MAKAEVILDARRLTTFKALEERLCELTLGNHICPDLILTTPEFIETVSLYCAQHGIAPDIPRFWRIPMITELSGCM